MQIRHKNSTLATKKIRFVSIPTEFILRKKSPNSREKLDTTHTTPRNRRRAQELPTLQMLQTVFKPALRASIWEPLGFSLRSAARFCASIFCLPLVIPEPKCGNWVQGQRGEIQPHQTAEASVGAATARFSTDLTSGLDPPRSSPAQARSGSDLLVAASSSLRG